MARTAYTRSALARTLHYSDVTDNDYTTQASSASFDGNVNKRNHHTGYSTHQSSGLSSRHHHHQQQSSHGNSFSFGSGNESPVFSERHGQYLKNNGGGADSGMNDEYRREGISSSSIQSDFWSFFSWRKHLYFALSKPTHFDVEVLARIATFGKGKTILFLLVPLLLALFASAWSWTGTSQQQAIISSNEEKNSNFLWHFFSNFSFKKYMWNFIPAVEQGCDTMQGDAAQESVMSSNGEELLNLWQGGMIHSKSVDDSVSVVVNQKLQEDVITESKFMALTKDEVKLLVQNAVKEEISSYFKEKSKLDKLRENEMHKIKEEIGALSSKFNTLSGSFNSFKDEVDVNFKQYFKYEESSSQQSQQFDQVKAKLNVLEKLILESVATARNCCMNETELDRKFAAMLLSIMDESDDSFKPIRDWMALKYLTKQQLDEELLAIKQRLKNQEESTSVAVKTLVAEHVGKLAKQFSESGQHSTVGHSLSKADILKIVKEALMLYDADKTGETDFALESGGGAVVNTRCSETYNEGRPSLIFFGIPLWNVKSSPRNAIQPDLHPGQCWAFKGSQGFLVIELSATIRPTSFVIEHIPKSLSPTGSIDSAPKEFSVWGLVSEKDSDGKLLGEYTYDKDGEPLQKFPVQATDVDFYPYVELQIHSNHGDLKYTCLYRFRVHGTRT